mgnify:CR=1 FL=1
MPLITAAKRRTTPLEAIAGFLALIAPRAGEISARLRERGVWTDYRADQLRLGPGPYLDDQQLRQAMTVVGEVARSLPVATR